jgi:hypothetical protein
MAFVNDSDTQDPTSQEAQDERLRQSNLVTGGGAAIFGNAPAGGGAPASGNPAPKANTGGNWTNLESYLNANKDQAADMGGKIAGSVDQRAQEAQNQVGNLSDSFNQQVQANTVAANPDAVSKAISSATGIKAGQNLSDDDLNTFKQQAGASYGGPSDFTQQAGYGQAAQAVSGAESKLAQTQSEAGRQQLLKDQFSNASPHGYTRGENTLDQALVEGSPEAQKALGGVEQRWAGIHRLLGNAADTGSSAVEQARATDLATAKAARDALGSYASSDGSGGQGALGQFSGDLYKRANDAQSNYNTKMQTLQSSGVSGLSQDDLKALGLMPGTHNFGVQLTPNYFQAGMTPTLANTASADDYARQAALAKLAEVIPGGGASVGQQVLNQANVDQAGQAAGVGNNPLATVSPTYLSDVNAARLGLGQDVRNALVDSLFGGRGSDVYLDNWDPNTMTAQLASASNSALRPTISLDPNSSNYFTRADLGMKGGFLGDTVDWNSTLANSPAWQQLLSKINSTVDGAAPPTASTSVEHIGGTPMSQPMRYAHGGTVTAPPKEPGIPKLPKPASKLPKLPHFSEGGDVLDPNARAHIADKNFALPSQHKYPIHDIEHARNALARVAQYGTPQEQAVVRRQVHSHYPSLAKEHDFQSGGSVPGKPKVDYDSFANDTVKAKLSPGEVVLPLSVTHSHDPVKAAADFMAATLAKKFAK